MEGRPLMVPRENMDTQRRQAENRAYQTTPRYPHNRTRRNGKNYRTHPTKILLATHEGFNQKIYQELRYLSKY